MDPKGALKTLTMAGLLQVPMERGTITLMEASAEQREEIRKAKERTEAAVLARRALKIDASLRPCTLRHTLTCCDRLVCMFGCCSDYTSYALSSVFEQFKLEIAARLR